MTGRWSTRSSLGEGVRNSLAVTPLGLATWLLTAAIVSLGGLAEASAVEGFLRAEREWVVAGGTTLIAETDSGFVDPVRCESLNALPGVEASFATRRAEARFEDAAQPGQHLAVVGATPSALEFLDLPPDSAGAIVAETGDTRSTDSGPYLVLRELRSSSVGDDGFSRDLASAPIPVAGHANLDTMGEEFAGAVLVPVATLADADQCFIRTTLPASDSVRELVAPLLTHTPEQNLTIRSRITAGAFAESPSQRYAQRWPFLAPMIGGLILSLVWGLRWWMGRREDALYRTLGANHANLVAVRLVHWAVDAAIGLPLGLAALLAGALALGLEFRASLVAAWASIGVCMSVSFVVAAGFQLVWPRRRVVEALRE